jgi:hypothetical protein
MVANGKVYLDSSDIFEWAKAVIATASTGIIDGYEVVH